MTKKDKNKESPKKKRSPQAIGRHNQRKGKAWQHAVAKTLNYVVNPSSQEDSTHAAVSNHGGIKGEEDILLSPEMDAAFPFFVECKDAKSLHIPKWWKELCQDREQKNSVNEGIIVSRLYGTSTALVTLDFMVFLQVMFPDLEDHQLVTAHRILFNIDAKDRQKELAKSRRQHLRNKQHTLKVKVRRK